MPGNLFPKFYADAVARWRVPSGFLLLAAFLWFARPTWESIALGTPLALAGLWLRGWAAGHLEKNEKVVSSGPYKYLRNPLYAGTLLVAAGLTLASCQWGLAVLFGAVFLGVYWPRMELEDQHLRNLFIDYPAYAQQVPLLWPRWPGLTSPGVFQWSLYLRNEEYNALGAFLIAMTFLAWRAATRQGL